ncbi:MAG TPA: AmiS/UreI family transporter, partial [Streptosporangiaceae bacterium]
IASQVPAMETAAIGSTVRGGGGYAGDAATGQELGGERVAAPPRDGEAHPLFIQNREIAILNIFTGFIGLAIAIAFVVSGGLASDPTAGLPSIRAGGAILLFAFTYLWVAYNQYANAGGRGLGWYSAFVAVTAIVFGVYTVQNTPDSNTADLWLAGNWFAWAILWAMFFALLTLELPIARLTGWAAIVIGIGTSWALAIALLWGKLAFA